MVLPRRGLTSLRLFLAALALCGFVDAAPKGLSFPKVSCVPYLKGRAHLTEVLFRSSARCCRDQ